MSAKGKNRIVERRIRKPAITAHRVQAGAFLNSSFETLPGMATLRALWLREVPTVCTTASEAQSTASSNAFRESPFSSSDAGCDRLLHVANIIVEGKYDMVQQPPSVSTMNTVLSLPLT